MFTIFPFFGMPQLSSLFIFSNLRTCNAECCSISSYYGRLLRPPCSSGLYVYSYLLGVTVLKMGMSGLLDLYDSTAVPCQGNYLNFVSHFCCVGDKSLEFRLRFLCFCTGSAVRVLKGLNANFSYTAMGMYRRL